MTTNPHIPDMSRLSAPIAVISALYSPQPPFLLENRLELMYCDSGDLQPRVQRLPTLARSIFVGSTRSCKLLQISNSELFAVPVLKATAQLDNALG